MPPISSSHIVGDDKNISNVLRGSSQQLSRPSLSRRSSEEYNNKNPYTGDNPGPKDPPLMDPGTIGGVSVAAVAAAVVAFFVIGTIINVCYVRRQAKKREHDAIQQGRWPGQAPRSRQKSHFGAPKGWYRITDSGSVVSANMQEKGATLGLAISEDFSSAKLAENPKSASNRSKTLPPDPPVSSLVPQLPFASNLYQSQQVTKLKKNRPASTQTVFEEDTEGLLKSPQPVPISPEEPPPAYAAHTRGSSLRPRQPSLRSSGAPQLPKLRSTPMDLNPPLIKVLTPVSENPTPTDMEPSSSFHLLPRPPFARNNPFAGAANGKGSIPSPMFSPARVVSYIPGYYTSQIPPSPFTPGQNQVTPGSEGTSSSGTCTCSTTSPDYISHSHSSNCSRATPNGTETFGPATSSSEQSQTLTSFESTLSPEVTPPEDKGSYTSPILNDQPSPLHGLSYPSVPRASNQTVPRSPRYMGHQRNASSTSSQSSVKSAGRLKRQEGKQNMKQDTWQGKWAPRMSGDHMVFDVS